MLWTRALRSTGLRRAATSARCMSSKTKLSSVHGTGAYDSMYRTFFSNNVTYVSAILVAALVVEGVYGSATTALWESINQGRLYHHIDWSKFKTDDEEEEEEEEEEDDE